jgi:hypothetical protein
MQSILELSRPFLEKLVNLKQIPGGKADSMVSVGVKVDMWMGK